MQPFTDDAAALNADFTVERSAGGFDLTFEAWWGRQNYDYNIALNLLLARLGEAKAILRGGVVDSRVARQLPLADRRIVLRGNPYPIALEAVPDYHELRSEMTRSQQTIARKPNAKGKGNGSKKIRLSLGIPIEWSLADLETFLASGVSDISQDQLDEEFLISTLDQTSLWNRYQSANPIVRERISRSIERGPIGSMVKKINEYRCQLCNALDRPWSSFSTPSGGLYIEAHHVIPVSAGGAGVLGAGNVITVCPNHHRQLHYGRVDVMDVGDEFSFVFDGGEPVRIQKFQTPERQ